ncbi:MAG: hypothetical protein MUC54_08615 [Chloroflexi bacterium]|jgi:hypothetical protein|nr:hypothetical protein [Chloroflexota bacterium]
MTERPTGPAARIISLVLSVGAVAVFAVLWVGFAVGLATGGALLADAWAWLSGLEPVWAVIAWIALLPIAVGLWAWNAAGSPLVIGAVLVGLVAWTALAVSGLARALRAR